VAFPSVQRLKVFGLGSPIVHLQFLPKKDWDVDQEYKVTFEKGKIEAEHIKLAEYNFKFQSASFTAKVESMEFYQDPVNPKLKKVVATVRFSHPIESSDIEKKVQLKFAEKKKGIQLLSETKYGSKIAYDKYKLKAFIHSDPVSIPDEDTYMKLFVDSGIRSSKGGELKEGIEQQIAIPGKYTFFQVTNSELALANNDKYETEQVFILGMTNGVTSKELEGKIEAFLLPKYHPNNKEEGKKGYNWNDSVEITPEVLNASSKLNLEAIETEKEYDSTHSFRYKADVGRYVFIRVKRGVQSFGGYVLAKAFDAVERVPEFPEELQIIGNGSILSLNGEKKISVFTRATCLDCSLKFPKFGSIKFIILSVKPMAILNNRCSTVGSVLTIFQSVLQKNENWICRLQVVPITQRLIFQNI
jgi:hypothetical protein